MFGLATLPDYDIALAIAILLCASAILASAGSRFSRSRKSANVLALCAVVLTLAFAGLLHGRLVLARLIPLSNAIVLGNWLPLGAALLAGVVHGQPDVPKWRKGALMLALFAVGWLSVVWSISPHAPFQPLNCYANGVCIQSTPTTCSACSVVTLLGHYGIESSELEMAELCLTGGRGTNLLGIYRGLVKKTQTTPYQVRTIVQYSFEDLQRNELWPMLVPLRQSELGAVLPVGNQQSSSLWLQQLFGTTDHCVVIFGFTDYGTVRIGDPSNFIYNPVETSVGDLRRDWLGDGFLLVAREE